MKKIKSVNRINHSRACLVYYSFIAVCSQLNDKSTIEDVGKLKCEGVDEVGFREFLSILVSVDWDNNKLTEQEIKKINLLKDYLKQKYKEPSQKISQGGKKSFNELMMY